MHEHPKTTIGKQGSYTPIPTRLQVMEYYGINSHIASLVKVPASTFSKKQIKASIVLNASDKSNERPSYELKSNELKFKFLKSKKWLRWHA